MTKIKEYYKQAKINATKIFGVGYDTPTHTRFFFTSFKLFLLGIFFVIFKNYLYAYNFSGNQEYINVLRDELSAIMMVVLAVRLLYVGSIPFMNPVYNCIKTIIGDVFYRIDYYLKIFFKLNKKNTYNPKQVLSKSINTKD